MEGTNTIVSAFQTGLNDISADVMEIVGVALPIALGIVGIFVAVNLGMRFFKSVAK